jgi:hypothetical protein
MTTHRSNLIKQVGEGWEETYLGFQRIVVDIRDSAFIDVDFCVDDISFYKLTNDKSVKI